MNKPINHLINRPINPGLYKQLAIVKDLLAEYRESPATSAPLRGPIVANLNQAGLQEDCPLREGVTLDEAAAEALSEEASGAIFGAAGG